MNIDVLEVLLNQNSEGVEDRAEQPKRGGGRENRGASKKNNEMAGNPLSLIYGDFPLVASLQTCNALQTPSLKWSGPGMPA